MNKSVITPNPDAFSLPSTMELWGGVECTVNRVGDQYFDQLAMSGHDSRLSDLDRMAELGITAIRYPILWERVAPDGPEKANWDWSDERLYRLKALGIKPIVGLVHHGSGPAYTSLIDPDFAPKMADYAQAVAERYPWVDAYTPVNEPLTTARFSGLYGFWYPHAKDDATFATALLNECRGTVLSMQAIRRVNPSARLIQTEDFGQTYATLLLTYQAELENQRRYSSFDLLCGTLTPDELMWQFFTRCADVSIPQLEWFLENPCPPDIMGINYYLTSDRYLDENLSAYPPHTHGGNGRHAYADVESVRTPQGITGYYALLKLLWDRYHLPLAITEAHLGGTREEQIRWLHQGFKALNQLRSSQVDVRAMTIWSMFGAYNWHCLVTENTGCYESGVFDLRSPEPRATALASWIKTTTGGNGFHHPLLDTPGWWHRPEAQLYPAGQQTDFNVVQNPLLMAHGTRPVLITGATGTLGQAFARLCTTRGIPYYLCSRQIMDIADRRQVLETLETVNPWAVINTAGYVRVDEAERDTDRCFRENADGPANLAEACAQLGIQLVTFSSDLVFDGALDRPYVETDRVAPLNVYGHSKALAEERVLQTLPTALIIRTSAFFGPWDRYNFLTLSLEQLIRGQSCMLAEDCQVSPTYVPDLVNATLDLLIDGESGLWHLANTGVISWAACVAMATEIAIMKADKLMRCRTADLSLTACRPVNSALGSQRGILMPPLSQAIHRYIQETRTQPMLATIG